MRLLFLMLDLPDFNSSKGGFYADIIKEMALRGHEVYAICKNNCNKEDGKYKEGLITTVRINVPFLRSNTSLIKKGIGSLLMNPSYIKAYNKYLGDIEFDYVIVPTPPASLIDVVKVIVKNKKTKLYVILRDIQPECAKRNVSKDILKRTDVFDECKKSFNINFFATLYLRRKSQQLYKLASIIGCMSPGNMAFVRKIAPYVDPKGLQLLPNWYSNEGQNLNIDNNIIRKKYNLVGKFVALFGGNIGPQQAVWNIAQLAKQNLGKKDVVFLIVGRGTKKHTLEEIARKDKLSNMLFLEYMPKEDYDAILKTADLGIISLDEKYIVPTCPSKIIGYMALKKPVLAMINEGNDYGVFYIDKPHCGLWSVGQDNKTMQDNFEWFYSHPKEREIMGESGYNYYREHFSVNKVAELLEKQLIND